MRTSGSDSPSAITGTIFIPSSPPALLASSISTERLPSTSQPTTVRASSALSGVSNAGAALSGDAGAGGGLGLVSGRSRRFIIN